MEQRIIDFVIVVVVAYAILLLLQLIGAALGGNSCYSLMIHLVVSVGAGVLVYYRRKRARRERIGS